MAAAICIPMCKCAILNLNIGTRASHYAEGLVMHRRHLKYLDMSLKRVRNSVKHTCAPKASSSLKVSRPRPLVLE